MDARKAGRIEAQLQRLYRESAQKYVYLTKEEDDDLHFYSEHYKVPSEVRKSDKVYYPNILLWVKVSPTAAKRKLLEQGAIMNSDSEKKLECESKAKYQIRRLINNAILKQRLKGTPVYYPELVDEHTMKGIPYEKKKHGIFRHNIDKFEKRTGIKLSENG